MTLTALLRGLAFGLALLTVIRAASAQETPEDPDRCHAYAVDIEAGRELLENFDPEAFAEKTDEGKKALAARVETRFEAFIPKLAEEELTNKTYQFPWGVERTITSSVYYTDERMGIEAEGRSHVLYSMLLCVVVGDFGYENACDAPGSALAEMADTKFNVKARVTSRLVIGGRPYTVGLECERPSALKALSDIRNERDTPR